MHSTISLLGIYRYLPDLFENFVIPEDLDKDDLIDNLLMETADLEMLYSDGDFLKLAIGSWSRKNLEIWQKLLETTQYEYNPIWNVDGTTKETRQINRGKTFTERGTTTNTGTTSLNGTSHDTSETTQTSSGDTLNKSNTFNAADMINNNKTETEGQAAGTAENNGTTTQTGSSSDNGTSSRSGGEDESTRDVFETERHGNIGVTTTQQMIREEREVVMLNLYDVIIDDFKKRFCLLIY